jgi:hypothetical protein
MNSAPRCSKITIGRILPLEGRWRLSQDVHTPAVIGFALQEIDALRMNLLLSRRTPAGVPADGRIRRQTGTRGPTTRPVERPFRRSRRVPVPTPVAVIACSAHARHGSACLYAPRASPLWRKLDQSVNPLLHGANAPRPTLETQAFAPSQKCSLFWSPLRVRGRAIPAGGRGTWASPGRARTSSYRLSRRPAAPMGSRRVDRFCLNSVRNRGECK